MKNYTIKLTAVTPFHVGSGVKYSKKEYYVNDRTNVVTLFDMNKIIEWIAGQDRNECADAFERFMLSQDNDISAFMRDVLHMSQEEQKECIAYSMTCRGATGNARNRDLWAFMRDAEGRPYVPGSSLKGALRTVLLVKMLRDRALRIDTSSTDLKKTADSTEVSLLNRLNKIRPQYNALNSIMSGFSVSDSLPFDKNKIMIAPKIDVNTDGEKTPLPLMRECAAPGTELLFSLTLSDEAERFIDVEYLKQAIAEFGGYYTDCYLSKYPKSLHENLDGCIFLGGGSGYYAKNIIYPLFAGDRQRALEAISGSMSKAFKKHGHNKDVRLGISPHMLKCTYVDGRLRQIGVCRVEFSERR